MKNDNLDYVINWHDGILNEKRMKCVKGKYLSIALEELKNEEEYSDIEYRSDFGNSMKKVKVTLANDNYFYTRMKGTDNQIIEHYDCYNYYRFYPSDCIKELEISTDDFKYLQHKENDIKKVYKFKYDNENNRYFY